MRGHHLGDGGAEIPVKHGQYFLHEGQSHAQRTHGALNAGGLLRRRIRRRTGQCASRRRRWREMLRIVVDRRQWRPATGPHWQRATGKAWVWRTLVRCRPILVFQAKPL